MFWGGEEERSIRTALAEEFNRLHEEIRIKPIHAPDDYDRKLKTMMGAGMAPDIFHLSDSEVAKWAAKGVLMDLMPFYTEDPEASLEDFVPQEVEKRMYDGRFFGISDATETMNTFYGTEMFRRWNVPFPPYDHVWSWDEFVGKVSGYHYVFKKGRIPGAVFGNCGSDAYHMENYRNVDLTTREYHEVESLWRQAGVTRERFNAFYCGTGWRASEAFLNAHLLGWDRIAVYDGGWYEWSADPANPIAVGEPS